MTSVKLFKTPKTETVLNNELFLKAIAKGLTGKQLRVIICIDALRGAGDVVFPAEIQGHIPLPFLPCLGGNRAISEGLFQH
jgi:hypothetical protein